MRGTQEDDPKGHSAQQELQSLEGRDVQLLSITVLMLLVMAAAVVALILPNVVWNLPDLRLKGRYLPQLLFGFVALIILFNVYVIDQRRLLRKTRNALLAQLGRAHTAERLSLVDPLTDVFNRRYMDYVLPMESKRADRTGNALTLLMIDVNDFKVVNDRFGHAEGDRFLQGVVQVLKKTFRQSDTIIRYGGDEFLVLMPDTDEKSSRPAMERLLKEVDGWNRAHPDAGHEMALSCGLASYRKGATIADVLDLADQQLYLRKNQQPATN
ncbi:MAG: GGDEF domain-containing protein [Terriglobia bacterium]